MQAMSADNIWHKLPKPFSVLAPMEDVTDTVFRNLVIDYGRPDVFFTEFTSADGMASPGREKIIHRLNFQKHEKPLIAQIWGNKSENYFKAAREIAALGFDGLDINMGCPVSKVIGKGSCSALIDNQTLAGELIEAAREGLNGQIPLSVKTRLGFKQVQTEEWFDFLLGKNLAAITVHGRVAKHLSKYPADWSEISKVVKLKNEKSPATIIIGNGDINQHSQIDSYHQQYGVDGVMIGRGIFHNLFIFNPLGPKSMAEVSKETKLRMLKDHIYKHQEFWGERTQYAALKKFFKIYLCSFPGASELRVAMLATQNAEEAMAVLNETMVAEAVAETA